MGERTAQRARRVWLAAWLLACVSFVSIVIAVAVAFGVTNNQTSTFVVGASQQLATDDSADVQAAADTASAQNMATANPGVVVRDENGTAWTAQTAKVNVFLPEYQNPDGNAITVNSNGEDNVVAPGTTNKYDFSVSNVSESEVTYLLTAETVDTSTDYDIPLEARVKSSNGWLAGGDDEWVPLEKLGVLEQSATLPAKQSTDYSLEWRWRFERDDAAQGEELQKNDAEDTRLGNLHLSQSVDPVANVNLNVVASYDETTADADGTNGAGGANGIGDHRSSLMAGLPVTSDLINVIPIIVVAIVSAAVAVGLLIRGRRNRNK